MKKIISFLLVAVFSFAMFSACTPSEVTDENVSDLFKPSLEAYVCYNGSGVLEFEKGEDGNAIEYDNFIAGDGIRNLFKVVEDITVQEVKNRLDLYVYDTELGFDEDLYLEQDGDLYLAFAAYGTSVTQYDLNSIDLYKTEEDRYYVTVDTYGIYPVTDENHDEGDIVYIESKVFITTLNNGILYIEGVDEGIKKEKINDENKRFYIDDTNKFYVNSLNTMYNLTEK